MTTRNRFQKGSGCFICQDCKKKTRSTGNGDNEHCRLCEECYEKAGDENALTDGEMTQAEFDAKWNKKEEIEIPTPSKKKEKKVTSKKNKTAEVAEVLVEKALRNAFGTLLTEETSKIDAALTNEPKKMKQLIADSGAEGRSHYDHLNRLVRLGLIEKTPEGYKLLTTTETKKKRIRPSRSKKTQSTPQASA